MRLGALQERTGYSDNLVNGIPMVELCQRRGATRKRNGLHGLCGERYFGVRRCRIHWQVLVRASVNGTNQVDESRNAIERSNVI